jgi:hypothetical protein
MSNYYLVLADTPTFKKGEKLNRFIIGKHICYGTDKKNKFHGKPFLDSKPELFLYIK